MTSELVHKDVDADETDDAVHRRARRRRRLTLAAAGAGAVLVATAVVVGAVTQPWADDDDPASARPAAEPGEAGDGDVAPVAQGDLPFVVLGDLPDEWVVQWVSDPTMAGGPIDGGVLVDETIALLAAPDAGFSEGPWISVGVQLLDRFDRRSFDAESFMGMGPGAGRAVTVGGLKGVIAEDWWGPGTVLLYGPVNDGFAVTLNSQGVEDADLVRFAEDLTFVEDGTGAVATAGAVAADLGLEPVVAYTRQVMGLDFSPPLPFSASMSTLNVGWGEADGVDSATISITRMPVGIDFRRVAEFYLGDAQEVAVGEWRGFAGVQDDDFGFGSAVVWEVEGAAVLLGSTLPLDELIDLAAGAEPTDAAGWAALMEEAEAWQGDFDDGMPDETWLIAAIDAEDATTYVVEGAVDEDGAFAVCTFVMATFESMSGCGPAEQPDLPSIIEPIDSGGGPGDDVYIGVAPRSTQGVLLQVLSAGGDVVTEVPLRDVRPDWPFVAGAVLLPWDGTVRLVAADGTVLDEVSVSEEDLGVVPAGDGIGGEDEAPTAATAAG